MKNSLKRSLFIGSLFLTGVLFWSGCDDNKTSDPEIVSISPKNKATNVAKTTSVEIRFNQSMDENSSESRFGLHTGIVTGMSMMGMGSTLGDVSGQYNWNDDHTVMMFQPDSMLMDSTMYSICLMAGMETADHQGSMMMGGMMEHGSMLDDGMVTTFSTE